MLVAAPSEFVKGFKRHADEIQTDIAFTNDTCNYLSIYIYIYQLYIVSVSQKKILLPSQSPPPVLPPSDENPLSECRIQRLKDIPARILGPSIRIGSK